MIGRRGFLAGTAALLAGCGRSPAPREVAGEVLGASARTGHRLREGGFPPVTRRERTGVALVGGGVAALSAAWRLARAGFDDFRVYEMEDAPGGNSRYAEYPESAAPWAAHYLPIPTVDSRAVLALLEEAGLVAGWAADGRPRWEERHLCHAPDERLYCYGTWIEGLYPRIGASPEDVRQAQAFYDAMDRWRERGAFRIPLARSPDAGRDLDGLSMAQWMARHGWDSPRLRWHVEYGCRDDYGTTLEATSAWAGLHYFASRDPEGLIFTWPEGNGWLVRHLLSRIGDRVTPGALAFRVASRARGVEVDYLDVARGESVRVEASRAVVCLPSFLRPRVVEGDLPARAFARFTYAPWAVANVVLDRPPADDPRGAPLSWDNVIYDSPSLGYVVATHQSLRTVPGPTVLTWYRALVGDPAAERTRLLESPWEAWRDEVLGELESVHPGISGTVRRLDVMPLGHAMIRPSPGFLWGPDRFAAALPRERLHFAHSDLSGISIFEEAQYHGVRAAEEVLAAMGRREESIL